MIYVFVPYYHEDTPEFKKSLESQTVPYRLIKRNRKASKILWTEAINDFWHDSFKWGKDDDVVCIMNNDIEFDGLTFKDFSCLTKGEISISEGTLIDWQKKSFKMVKGAGLDYYRPDSFIGHCFAMTLGDFKKLGGFCKLLPHALADIDYGIKALKRLRVYSGYAIHKDHAYEKTSKWSWRSYDNPIVWTIFLLRHPNRYTLLNIARCWYDGIFR